MERVGPDLAAERDALFLAGQLGQLLPLLLLSDLEQSRLENPHRGVAVAELRAFVLTLHDDVRRQVRDADGRVGRVDALTARARGAKDVDADFVVARRDAYV